MLDTDVASFALGVLAGALLLTLGLAVLVTVRLRRMASAFPLLGGLRPRAPMRPAARVETDGDGYILTQEDPDHASK